MTHHAPQHASALRALEEASADDPAARGALRLGLWAGRRLGYDGGCLALYAFTVMDTPDALARVANDLAARGVSVPAEALRARLSLRPANEP